MWLHLTVLKCLQEAMNTAVGSLIAQSNNFVAAQLKVKSSELAQAEKQKTLEEAAAKLLQTQLADELATMNQSSAELRIKQLVGHIHSLEELAVQTTNEATEAAAKGSLKWQEATAGCCENSMDGRVSLTARWRVCAAQSKRG